MTDRRQRWPSWARGDVILAWRTALGMSRKATAAVLGIGCETLHGYEDPAVAQRQRAYQREWLVANRDKKKLYNKRSGEKFRKSHDWNARMREWRESHPDATREINRRADAKRRKAHPEIISARIKKWDREHPANKRAAKHKRRGLESGAHGACTPTQATARISVYGGLCAYCGHRPHEHLDHVVPLSRGGTNWPANLRPSCGRCNSSKGSKLLSEWVR